MRKRAGGDSTVPNVWCVRADGGTFTDHFLSGGYVAIKAEKVNQDLSHIRSREGLHPLVRAAYPDESAYSLGGYVGDIARLLLDIKAGDYIITPAADTEWLHYGTVAPEPSYFYGTTDDGCPYRHRRRVQWAERRLRRNDFSIPFQRTMCSSSPIFAVRHEDEFLTVIGRTDLSPAPSAVHHDPRDAMLEQVLELSAKDFEILVVHLLTALAFESSELTGKPGDGGVDATGELNVANLAKVKVFVQAKRYKLGTKISARTVRELRQAIPFGGQGAFITTADFQNAAADVAFEPGFPRIGLINGHQLVDLLVEHWDDIPEEFRERLGLKPGLVRS